MEEKATGKVSGGNMPNMQTVKLVQDLIKDQFGTLDDLPKEISITIVNLYYKLTVKVLEMMGVQRRCLSESEKGRIRQFGLMVGRLVSEEPQILDEVKSALENAKASRKTDREASLKPNDSTAELDLLHLKNNGNVQGMRGISKLR